MTEIIDEVAAPDNLSVTIILVPKDEIELSKKRFNFDPEAVMQTVKNQVLSVESDRLRECSRYFAACMSGRWQRVKYFILSFTRSLDITMTALRG